MTTEIPSNDGGIPPKLMFEILTTRAANDPMLALHMEAAMLQALARIQSDTIRQLTAKPEQAETPPAKKLKK